MTSPDRSYIAAVLFFLAWVVPLGGLALYGAYRLAHDFISWVAA